MEDLDELEKERTLLQAVHQPYRKKFDFTSDRIRHTHVKQEKVASTEMCTFLVLNISSLQLIPVTVIAYRSKYGSPGSRRVLWEQPLWLRHFLRWRELSLQRSCQQQTGNGDTERR